MSFLIDTNVISEPQRVLPNENVLSWIATQDESRLYLSAITIGEINRGVEKLTSGKKKASLKSWLEELRAKFAGRILPITEQTFVVWGKMYAEFENDGLVRSSFDSLLEATALENDLILVTRNEKNFQRSDVTIFNPWIV